MASGVPIGFFQDWLREDDPDSAYWAKRSYAGRRRGGRRAAGVAISTTAGWQDIFLPWQLADHAALRAAGARPLLRIGPWVHTTPAGMAAGIRDALTVIDRAMDGPSRPFPTMPLPGARSSCRAAAGERHLADWPPEHTRERAFYLRTDHGLVRGRPGVPHPRRRLLGRHPDRLRPERPDPRRRRADPRPAAPGPATRPRSRPATTSSCSPARCSTADLVALGPGPGDRPRAGRRWSTSTSSSGSATSTPPGARSTSPTGSGASAPGAPPRPTTARVAVEVELWPVGHRFAAGHRLRVQVSGGAHPRFARHPGTAVAARRGPRARRAPPRGPPRRRPPVARGAAGRALTGTWSGPVRTPRARRPAVTGWLLRRVDRC